jgi:shikimate kinase
MNLVLIGYRGTGKSTIGKLLSESLNMPYVGFDEEIVKRSGMTIPEIVERFSWDHFRDIETKVVKEYSSLDNQVLDTGGGVITREENTVCLKKTGIVFLLETEIKDIIQRIGISEDRPSLTGAKNFIEEIEEVLELRQPLYQSAADFVVNTSHLGLEESLNAIVDQFREATSQILKD